MHCITVYKHQNEVENPRRIFNSMKRKEVGELNAPTQDMNDIIQKHNIIVSEEKLKRLIMIGKKEICSLKCEYLQ